MARGNEFRGRVYVANRPKIIHEVVCGDDETMHARVRADDLEVVVEMTKVDGETRASIIIGNSRPDSEMILIDRYTRRQFDRALSRQQHYAR